MDTVTIQGKEAVARSPEGQTAKMKLDALLEHLSPPRMKTGGMVIPRGVEWMDTRGPMTIWAHVTPPRVYNFQWVAPDSPVRFGSGAKYRPVQLALPYLVVMAVFEDGVLSGVNECFFRVAPLDDETDELLYPALLNCSRFEPPDGKPLSWICTAKLDTGPVRRCRDPKKRMRVGLKALLHCLLDAGFNYSSDDHEFSSWFTESTRVDPRVKTVEDWEQASKDPLFVLDVPWLKTGKSVRQVADRIFANRGLPEKPIVSSTDLARIIFNHSPS
jgi:hypothetical protein